MKRYGFIRTREEIKFLILTCMKYLTFPVDFSAIVDICTWCDEGFDYFDFEECFYELEKTGHTMKEDNLSKITTLGIKTSELFADNLPFSVRQSAEMSALRVMRKIRRDADIITSSSQKGESEFEVLLEMKDVISIKMTVSSQTQATILQSKFKKNAEKSFQDILEALTSDR